MPDYQIAVDCMQSIDYRLISSFDQIHTMLQIPVALPLLNFTTAYQTSFRVDQHPPCVTQELEAALIKG